MNERKGPRGTIVFFFRLPRSFHPRHLRQWFPLRKANSRKYDDSYTKHILFSCKAGLTDDFFSKTFFTLQECFFSDRYLLIFWSHESPSIKQDSVYLCPNELRGDPATQSSGTFTIENNYPSLFILYRFIYIPCPGAARQLICNEVVEFAADDGYRRPTRQSLNRAAHLYRALSSVRSSYNVAIFK